MWLVIVGGDTALFIVLAGTFAGKKGQWETGQLNVRSRSLDVEAAFHAYYRNVRFYERAQHVKGGESREPFGDFN